MIVLIGGMHRSGTSLLARMLNQLGMYLGPEEKMMPAAKDNPEGFWENLDFVKLNNQLLEHFAGAWDLVPELPEKWFDLAELQPLFEQAQNIIQQFSGHDFWGWKDPRNSITWPFWQKLLPEARFILMVRHPLEVARSLHKRNFFSLANGLHLWKKYNAHWVTAGATGQFLVVHYEALLSRPVAEIERIARWLEMTFSEEMLKTVSSVVKNDLRHQRSTQIVFNQKDRFSEVWSMYRQLCQMAEFVPQVSEGTSVVTEKTSEHSSAVGNPLTEYCPNPIFVIGCHRSGTSVLAHSLAQHSHTWVGEESNFIAPLARQAPELYRLGTQRGERHWLSAQKVDFNEFMFYLGLGINALYTQRAGGKRWIEQTPEYTLDALSLAGMFPGAHFVNIIRDGRDVVQSMINSGFNTPWAKDFKTACQTWVRFVTAGLILEKEKPAQTLRVYYEWLKKEPERQFKTLAGRLNLPFEPALTDMFARGRVINSSFSGKNKLNWQQSWSEEQKKLFWQIAGRLLLALGYEKDATWIRASKPEHALPPDNVPAEEILAQLNVSAGVPVTKQSDLRPRQEKAQQAKVSIVIPLFNKLELTHQCLKAILQNTRYANYEIIFVDNGSTDETPGYLRKLKLPNVKLVLNEQNLGFVKGCNKGAELADGEFILFLNNDTRVQPGWLEALVKTMQERPDCGVVGSKLIYPDGKLQEAGGIIFSDGLGWNYGRGMNPNDPRFNFVREVDYVSGAALMIRKSLWRKIGGFDERFSPAYYEDTDLCFSVRQHGFKVLYQPRSVVVHFEGQTAGTNLNAGFKKFQQINHQKFKQKWQKQLQAQYKNDPQNVPFASQRNVRARIFISDPFLPMWDRASGSLRLFNYIKILKEQGNHITFLARLGSTDQKYRETLQQMGVEVYENDENALKFAGYTVNADWPPIPYDIIFEERKFDLAILSFWYHAEYYLDIIRKKSPATKIIIDTVDIHFVREMREAQLKKDKRLEREAKQRKEREINVYRQADRLWVVTEADRQHIKQYVANTPIDIVPNIHEPVQAKKTFAQTSDLLFVGNFSHRPNVDAVLYFVNEIFPEVKKELQNVRFFVVGNNPPPEIQRLNNQDIIVTGFVPDLKPYLIKARISVSPLRYGAGMKGKVGEALSYGLPVVTTSIGAEGMNLIHEKHVLIADQPHDFARQIVRLYNDETLWQKLAKAGKNYVLEQWGPQAVKQKLQKIVDELNANFNIQPKVSIVMLTFNALEYTKKCVQSILQNTRLPYEIIFVDNGSTDGTVEYLKKLQKEHRHIKTIFNSRNKGFAAGNNQGARRAKGKYLLFLNNDVLVAEGWLEHLVQALEKDPQIGMVGPVTNYISGLQRLAQIPYHDEQGFFPFAQKVLQLNKEKITPRRRIAGFCLLMPRTLFKKVKGFDETFGTGNFEDDDLCLRVRKKGFALMVHEGVFIHHYGSQTFKENKIAYEESINKKSKIFFKKHPDVDYEELLELKNPLSKVHGNLKKELSHALNEGNFKRVKEWAQTILNDNPLDDEAWFYLALAHKQTQNFTEALKAVERILRHDFQNAGALNLKGEILLALQEVEGARLLFQWALDVKPDFQDARRNLAHCLIENNEYEEGIKLLTQILQEQPDDIPTLLYLAGLHFEAEKFEEAADFVDRVLKIEPENQLAQQMWQLLPQDVLLKRGRQQEIEKAIRALQRGEASLARSSFENLKDEEPENVEVQYGYALSLQMLDDLKGAATQLQKVLNLQPDFTLALNDLARIEFVKGHFEQARNYFEKSLSIDPEQLNIKNQLSETLFALGEYEQGVQILVDILNENPDDLETLKHLAAIYHEAGNKEMSRALWMKVLTLNPNDEQARTEMNKMVSP